MTAAEKAAAASALGITVPAWRAGRRPHFVTARNGGGYWSQPCVPRDEQQCSHVLICVPEAACSGVVHVHPSGALIACKSRI